MRRYVFRLALLSLAALLPSAVRGDDQQIAQQIMQKLKAEKDAGTLKGFSIDLQVDEGTVWLSGRVASEQQQAKALDVARRIPGVQQVVNDLTISAPAPKTAVASKPVVNNPVASNPVPAGKPGIVMSPPPPATIPAPLPPPPAAVESRATTMGMAMTNPYATMNVPSPASKPAPKSAPAAFEPAPAVTSQSGAAAVANVPAIPVIDPAAMNQVAAAPESAASAKSARRPASPAQNSVLNTISKTLVSAVNGGHQLDEPPTHAASSGNGVQPVSVSQDVAAATGAGAIGSGVDSSTASSRRSVVQAAQPVANLPQTLATADSLQPLTPQAPQYAMMPMQMPYMVPVYAGSQMQVPLAMGPARTVNYSQIGGPAVGAPVPMYMPGSGVGIAPARYDHPTMPGYAWPSYAACPNYAAVTYPKQYSPTAWPYIGPFYPYPQVPLGWRKVTLEWDDGWWFLDFKDRRTMYNH